MMKHRRGVAGVAIVLLGSVLIAQAETYYWTGASAGLWTAPANWNPSTGYPQAADTAIFTGTVTKTVNLNGAQAANTVTVSDSAQWTWTAAANSLTLGAGGFNYGSTSAGNSQVDAILAGAGALTVNAGQLLLNNTSNSFTGGIYINGGTLLTPNYSLPAYVGYLATNTPITIGNTSGTNDAMLSLGSQWQVDAYVSNSITTRSGSSGKATIEQRVTGNTYMPMLAGPITLQKDLYLLINEYYQAWFNNGPGAMRVPAVIAGTGSLIKEGFGPVYVYGTNSYNGLTVVRGGSLFQVCTNNTMTGDIIVSNGVVYGATNGSLGNAANTITLGGNGTLGGLGAYHATSWARATFYRNVRLQGNGGILISKNNCYLEITGVVSGPGRLLNDIGSTSYLDTNNTYAGGTIVASGYIDVSGAANTNNNMFGPGNITIKSCAGIVIRGPRNVDAGARVLVNPINVSPGGGLYLYCDWLPAIDTNSSGFIHLRADSGPTLNARLGDASQPIGNGSMWIAAEENGRYLTSTSLAAVVANDPTRTYKLSTAAAITWRLNSSTGTGPLRDLNGQSYNVQIGYPGLAAAVVNAGSILNHENQTFSGTLTVYNGHQFSGYNISGNPFGATNGPVVLNGGSLRVGQTTTAVNWMRKGALTFNGYASLIVQAAATYTIPLVFDSATRTNRGTLYVYGELASLGTRERVILNSVPVRLNNMVAPYFWDFGTYSFVDHPDTNGFKAVTYDKTNLATATSVDKVNLASAEAPDAAGVTLYALKSGYNIGAGGTITNLSGGVILTGAGGTTNVAPLAFGANEPVIYVQTYSEWSGPIASTAGLTKSGPGTLCLTADNSASLSGLITINQGELRVFGTTNLGTATIVLNGGGLKVEGPTGTTYPVISNNIVVLAPIGGALGTVHYLRARPHFAGTVSGDGPLMLTSGNYGIYFDGTNTFTGGIFSSGMTTMVANNNGATLGWGDIYLMLGPGPTLQNNPCAIALYVNSGISTNSTLTLANATAIANLRTAAPRIGGLEGSGPVVLGDNGINSTLTVGLNHKDTDYFGQIINGFWNIKGSLVKAGTGTLTLWGENSYSGGTVVSNGTLRVMNWLNPTGAVQVLTGGILDGDGTVGPVTNLGGTVKGNLYIKSLALNSASTFEVVLNGTTVATDYGRLNVEGGINLNSDSGAGSILKLTLGFAPTPGQTFTILNNTSLSPITGQFACGRNVSGIYNGQTYWFSVNYQGGDGNDIVLTCIPSGSVFSFH